MCLSHLYTFVRYNFLLNFVSKLSNNFILVYSQCAMVVLKTRLSKDNGPASEEHIDSQRVHVAFP